MTDKISDAPSGAPKDVDHGRRDALRKLVALPVVGVTLAVGLTTLPKRAEAGTVENQFVVEIFELFSSLSPQQATSLEKLPPRYRQEIIKRRQELSPHLLPSFNMALEAVFAVNREECKCK